MGLDNEKLNLSNGYKERLEYAIELIRCIKDEYGLTLDQAMRLYLLVD